MSTYLFLLLLLACPLMMFLMMRGMHGGHGGSAEDRRADGVGGGHDRAGAESLDELRRQRDELERQIVEREAEEETPVAGGAR